jgi:hypothetical protein
MEDAMVLLQTGKRLASAAFRRESVCWSDDSFSLWNTPFSGDDAVSKPPATTPPKSPLTESETVNQLLARIKFLLLVLKNSSSLIFFLVKNKKFNYCI